MHQNPILGLTADTKDGELLEHPSSMPHSLRPRSPSWNEGMECTRTLHRGQMITVRAAPSDVHTGRGTCRPHVQMLGVCTSEDHASEEGSSAASLALRFVRRSEEEREKLLECWGVERTGLRVAIDSRGRTGCGFPWEDPRRWVDLIPGDGARCLHAGTADMRNPGWE